MKKFKMLAMTAVVGTSFVAGQMCAPTAGTAEPGSMDDPVVSESLLNQELGKLKTEITSLKSTVTTLESEVKKLSSNSGNSNSGNSNSTTSSIGTAIVKATSLNIRSGAGTNYNKVGTVVKGDKVSVLKVSGSWYQIKVGNVIGWVAGEHIILNSNNSSGSSTANKTGVITATSLNIRSGAGTNYNKVGTVLKGAKVTILKTSGSWCQIKVNNVTGWVSSEYVKVN